MTAVPLRLRKQARQDIQEAIDYYTDEAGGRVASGFIDSLQLTFRDIGRHPEIGSLRYGHELHIQGLRNRPLKRYPYLVFYIRRDDVIEIWRVLHAKRDVPAWLQGS